MAQRLIRVGRVSTVNREKGLISVTYPDLDDSVTDEFPIYSFTDEWKPPEVGSNILVLHLSNGQTAGVVMGRYWNTGNLPEDPEVIFRKELAHDYGEAYLEYDKDTLTIHVKKIVIEAEESALIQSPQIDVKADTQIHLEAPEILIDGETISHNDIKAGGVSLMNHTHTGVHGKTSPPN